MALMEFSAGSFTDSGTPIEIRWKDGRVQAFDAAFLRAHCPCSTCRNAQFEVTPAMFPGLSVLNTDLVGSYALQFHFSDGHGTGAYSIEYLQKLPDQH